jgi:serine/threonine protein kinase
VSDVYSLGCTLYYAVTGKVPFPGGTTADKIRRHLEETPLNPLHFNPDLPGAFCDVIAAMMDKNPDTRTPTAAAVVELLRPWCDEDATRHLAEASPAASGALPTVTAPPPPVAALDETASFVLDDAEAAPGQVESPSQISQGTVSLANEMEDTLAGVHAPRRGPARPCSEPISMEATPGRVRRFIVAAVLVLAAAVVIAAALLAGLL